MPESRRIYRVQGLNVNELNLVLSSISDRFDQIEGFRGNPEFFSTVTFNEDIEAQEAEIKYVDSTGTTLHSLGGI